MEFYQTWGRAQNAYNSTVTGYHYSGQVPRVCACTWHYIIHYLYSRHRSCMPRGWQPKLKMSPRTGSGNNSWTETNGEAIPTATSTFSTMPTYYIWVSTVGSADVGQCRQCQIGSGVIENVGIAVGMASASVSVQKLFPLPVQWPTLWVSDIVRCRTMSAVSYSSRALSKIWD